jgi:hypothetical protein
MNALIVSCYPVIERAFLAIGVTSRNNTWSYPGFFAIAILNRYPINLVIWFSELLKMIMPHSHIIDRKSITRYSLVQRKIQMPLRGYP